MTRYFKTKRDKLLLNSEALETEIKQLEKDTAMLEVYQTAVNSAAKSITRSDLTELKSFSNPPEIIQRVIICCSAILNESTDWQLAKNVT